MQRMYFQDSDRNIRAAREVAYNYMYRVIPLHNPDIKLPTVKLAGSEEEKCESRNLRDTLRSIFELAEPDMRAEALWEKLLQKSEAERLEDILPRPFDPDQDRRETEEMARREKEAEKMKKFRNIFLAMSLLADPSKAELDEAMVKDRILPLLAEAPGFIAQQLIPPASDDEVAASLNVKHAEKIARRIKAQLYPHMDPAAAEYTPSELSNTRAVLRYADEHFKVAELAVTNFLLAVQKVNAAAQGNGLHL